MLDYALQLILQVEGLDFIQLVADSVLLEQFKHVVKGRMCATC